MVDTVVISLSNRLNRLKDLEGLYPIGSTGKRDLFGFLISPTLVYDEINQAAIGLSHTSIIERSDQTRKQRDESRARFKENIEQKESFKWLKSCENSKESLKQAQHVTFVMDREADIIELHDRIPDEKTSILVRSNYDRKIKLGDGTITKMKKFLLESSVKSRIKLNIKSKKRKPRRAILEVKYETVELQWPKDKQTNYKKHPEGIKVTIIDVREQKNRGYQDEPELHWRLISSEEIKTESEALKQIEFYKRRWKVEEFFKLLKTDGYDIEGTELTKGKTIRKLTLMVMKASVKVLKLKAARDGNSDEKIESVFRSDEIKLLKLLNTRLEGKTEKQKNPHNPKSLSFASWVIARLGGWKEYYNATRPPGSKTFVRGLEKFDAMMIGFIIKK